MWHEMHAIYFKYPISILSVLLSAPFGDCIKLQPLKSMLGMTTCGDLLVETQTGVIQAADSQLGKLTQFISDCSCECGSAVTAKT